MRMPALIALSALLAATATTGAPAPQVEKKDQVSTVKLEHLVTGHMAELAGRYKLRATETVYQPGGYIGEHHHVGPGIRYVLSGELTYVQPDRTTIYKAGDYFYESGDTTHTASNRSTAPVTVINFELLPAGWTGASAVPPMPRDTTR